MSMETAVSAGKFTDEILSKNFLEIAKGFTAVDNRFDAFDSWFKHLEGHVGELYEMARTTTEIKVKTSGRIKPFLVGAAVGVVIYRYAKNNSRKIEQIKREAKEQVEAFVASQQNTKSTSADPA